MNQIAVIIVSWNTKALLFDCLSSLLSDIDAEDMRTSVRVIVVDGASSDGSVEMLRREFPHVELQALAENVGYVKANNLALRSLGYDDDPPLAAAGRMPNFVWLLNPDTRVLSGCMRTLLDFMQAQPHCGLCGPQLLNSDGSLQHGAFAFPGLLQLAIDTQPKLARFRNTRLDGRYDPAQYAAGLPFEIGFPLGAGMFASSHAVAKIGVLDERFEMYCEEVDWAMRMARRGFSRYCVPAAKLIHHGGASSKQASARTSAVLWRSRRTYYAKHYGAIKNLIAQWLAPR